MGQGDGVEKVQVDVLLRQQSKYGPLECRDHILFFEFPTVFSTMPRPD